MCRHRRLERLSPAANGTVYSEDQSGLPGRVVVYATGRCQIFSFLSFILFCCTSNFRSFDRNKIYCKGKAKGQELLKEQVFFLLRNQI